MKGIRGIKRRAFDRNRGALVSISDTTDYQDCNRGVLTI